MADREQVDPRKPKVTNNPKDPRLKAYNDSLRLYKKGVADEANFRKLVRLAGIDGKQVQKVVERRDAGKGGIDPKGLIYLRSSGSGFERDKPEGEPRDYEKYRAKDNDKKVYTATRLGEALRRVNYFYKEPTTPIVYQESAGKRTAPVAPKKPMVKQSAPTQFKVETIVPEVVVTAKKIDPKKYKTAKVKLYPSGTVEKSAIDSLHRAGRGKLIGEPVKMEGQIAVYGPDASDKIKRLIKRR